MHIKRVVVRGFKTYRTETGIDEFTPHCNLVLGKNGSGKSNLLDAISFVLTDKYAGLVGEERIKLLHEGAGAKIAQADVEVVFDNSDKRIPLDPTRGSRDSTEVRIRRTIGLKKDQYLVNDQPYSNADFQNLLESAGLSRSNPYYIVEQGKIAKLMKQAKSERLELLKEIAGTRTYDDRKKESLKIMKETDTKLKQIDGVISGLEEKLNDLEKESKEFKKFLSLDMTRRSLEYSIYEHERESASAKLDSIDAKRASGSGHAEEAGTKYADAQLAVKTAEEEIEQLTATLKKSSASKKTLTSQESLLLKRRTDLELNLKDLKLKISGAHGSKEEASRELKTIQKKMKDTNVKLQELGKEFTKMTSEEETSSTTYGRLDQRLMDLGSKRDRSNKFSTRKERDADIKKQVTKVTNQRNDATRQLEKLQVGIRDAQAASEKAAADIAKKESQMSANHEQAEKINAILTKLTSRRADGLEARKAAWKRESELGSEFAELKTKMEKAERALQSTMDKDTFRGLDGVKTIASKLNLTGVYGPLIELFECGVEFHQCVEITAGNSLFHVVVDTEATAARVVKELIAQKLGRATFIPLTRINPQKPDYPPSTDAMPMINQLKFDMKYEKAMLQVFGKTLIARDMSVAAHMSHQYNLNTITLSGDRVDKKGALTGGAPDISRISKLSSQSEIQSYRQRFEEVKSALEEVKIDVTRLDGEMTKFQSELSKQQDLKSTLRSQNTQWTNEIAQLKVEHKTLLDTMTRNEKLLSPLRQTLASLETQFESLESEMKSEFRSGLTEEEEDEWKRITSEIDQVKQELIQVRARRADVESQKVSLESLLNVNLNRRADELNARLNVATQEEDNDILQRDESELGQVVTQIKEIEIELKNHEKETEVATTRMRKLQDELEKLRSAASVAYAALSDDAKEMDKLLSQRHMFQQKKDDALKKIRDLGALPNDAFEKYKTFTMKQLFEKLDKTRISLREFGKINKKSLDQYTGFTEQKTELMERKQELDSGRVSIMELIQHLDQKKDEAIARTFKTIAHHFSQVFAELVPGGKATLVIETREMDGGDEAGPDEEVDEEERKSSERPKPKRQRRSARHEEDAPIPSSAYTGIKIQVNFVGGASHSHQLSGGQESVVALSLIFAIQRCDPSPFYLLDEIDSALDPVHRTAVTSMLKEQSKETQFICTTFHPEMLAAADKMFGVVFKNKASQVRVIEHEEAMRLIQVSEREAEAEPEQQ